MASKKMGVAAAALAATGVIVGAGAVIANASATPSTTTAASTTYGSAAQGYGPGGSGGAGGSGGEQAPQHTTVTGDEATKVGDAVKAKDSAVTVTSVQKDADGSYDVSGTKAGQNVRFEVSADLATITQGGGKGGPGGASQDTPVTGDEATKAGNAVTAKDSSVTVTSVRKDPDGSYDVLGTKGGQDVMFDVSADLSTVSQAQQGGQGGPGGQGSQGAARGQQGQAPSGSSSAAPTATATS